MENQNNELSKIDISGIDKQLQQIEMDKRVLDERERIFAIYRKYSENDRVISSKEFLEEIKDNKIPSFFKTGISKLDSLTDGFREGNLIAVSGVSASGKTTLAQSFLSNFERNKIGSLFFTFEVSSEELLYKFGEKVPLFYLPRQHEKSKIQWLEERILEAMAKFYVKIVFVDNLAALLDWEQTSKFGNPSLMIGSIVGKLKQIAIDNNLIIFLMTHFKKIKLDENEMPDMDGIRDSSLIGQTADFVLIMNRKKSEDRKNWIDEATLFLAKNRWNGKTGYVQLKHFDHYFSEIEIIHKAEEKEIEVEKLL